MSEFVDPDRFANDEELLGYIIDHVVKPQLQQVLGDTEDLDEIDLSGMAYIFGTRQGGHVAVIEQVQRLQELVEQGLSLDYILAEMTDLDIVNVRESEYRGMAIRYIEVEPGIKDESLSADQIAAIYARSPS
ncbi:MAG: hypothetical protein ACOCYP_10100 [Planctomycetota bacterium]